MNATPLLKIQGLTKRYGDVTVLRDVSLDFHAGEIHALLGANGAGKSTLCKIVSGLLTASSGSMQVSGQVYSPKTKQMAEAAGVEIVQQELNLIPTLSIAENLLLTRLPNRCGLLRIGSLHQAAREIMDRFGLADISTSARVESLGVGRQQMVEIATALARDCQLLILDEPTAALSGSESEQLFAHLKELRDSGVAIIYISHRLDEVAALSDKVTVLRDGKHVATVATETITTGNMVDMMSGPQANVAGETSVASNHQTYQRDEVALQVRSLSSGIVQDVSFQVHRGERFGITGLVGSGRTELLRAIFGAEIADSGEVILGDRSSGRLFRHPKQAVAAGLAMVTEDRKQSGLLLSQPVRVNTTLSAMRKRFSHMGLVAGSNERSVAEEMVVRLETHCEDIEQAVGTLSGGNQQKVAVAKWLVRDADVFLFDEPTRGIDVAARRRIYRLMETLSAEGKACVIVSSDLEELIETCDRIAVMCDGRMVETFARGDWSHERITQASFAEYVS